MTPFVVDSFAGGGGASTGIEMALGFSPSVAINHNPTALWMHAVNHPKTTHYTADVWKVHPMVACRGRRPELAWFSPDCTYFSRARGAKPFRDRNHARRRRGLAGVVIWWAATVKPKVIGLENVAEFRDWGPLDKETGLPCKKRKGSSFRRWVARLENLGYIVEWRELKACDYGTPTTRKRLFLIARCDGNPVVWPESTHGPGRPLPYRTAAECIDWSIPTRSIFGRKKPLAENTLRRIARGIFKYVLEADRPFIIPVTHAGDARVHGIDEPLRTVTNAPRGEHAVVVPLVMPATHGARDGKPDQRINAGGDPLPTVTTLGAQFYAIAPTLAKYHADTPGAERVGDLREPLPTQDTSNRFAVIAPTLIQTGYGERPGQAPRSLDLQQPLGTQAAGGVKHALVSAFLAKHFSERETGGWNGGCDARAPAGAVTGRDHHSLVTSHLVKMRGGLDDHQNTAQSVEEPLPTITARGNHVAEVRAFLIKFYKTGVAKQLDLPIDTITTKHRLGIVTIHGVDYQIVDIRMRMLEPHELFLAQGFPPDYVIDVGPHGEVLTKTEQVQMCGNSAPPPVVAALVAANCGYLRVERMAA